MPNTDLVITRIVGIYHNTTSGWSRPRPFPRPLNGLVLFTQGSIAYHFPDGDQTAHTGDVLVFPRGLVYSGEKQTDVNSFIVIDFETPEDNGLETLGLPVIMPSSEEIAYLFSRGAEEWHSGSLQSDLKCRSTLYAILAELTAMHHRGSRQSALLEEVLAWLHQHYTDPGLEIEQVSQRFHISSSQLRRLFHEALHVSPLQYVLELRMELAQNLLRHENLPIAEVAARTGFSSEFYFSRLFKQRTGLPPSRYHRG